MISLLVHHQSQQSWFMEEFDIWNKFSNFPGILSQAESINLNSWHKQSDKEELWFETLSIWIRKNPLLFHPQIHSGRFTTMLAQLSIIWSMHSQIRKILQNLTSHISCIEMIWDSFSLSFLTNIKVELFMKMDVSMILEWL